MRRESLEHVINVERQPDAGPDDHHAGTAFLSALALFLFGGEVLRGFAFTMIVGIITGTYSTVFIASAIVDASGSGKAPTRGGRARAGGGAAARRSSRRASRSRSARRGRRRRSTLQPRLTA